MFACLIQTSCRFSGPKHKKENFMKAIWIILAISLVGCATKSKEPSEKSRLNKAFVDLNIHKNKTSKTEVIELLGHPEMVNSDSEGVEQWVYYKSSSNYDSETNHMGFDLLNYYTPIGIGGIDAGSRARSSSRSTKSTTFYVYFNKKGVVSKFNFSASTYN